MNRIIISVTNDIATDQRVLRACDCFNEMGYEILLIGRQLACSLPISKKYKVFKFRLLFNKGFLFYAEYNLRLFIKLLFFKKKDLLFANDLDTLLPNFLVSKWTNCKLIYDSHEYFTEVPELLSRPKVKSFWLTLEKILFPKLKNVITVNKKIAEIYQVQYDVPVTAIKNVPSLIRTIKPVSFNFLKAPNQKIIIYQGALNLGRGLDLIIDTMPFLRNYVLIIAGDGDLNRQLRNKVELNGLKEKVFFLGKLLPEELNYVTMQADLGISLEEDLGLNYKYCLPNKVFDYIHAEIPVLVSDLPLMRNLLDEYKIGELVFERNCYHLAKQVERIISNKSEYAKELKRAKSFYNWEIEKQTLVNFIKNIE